MTRLRTYRIGHSKRARLVALATTSLLLPAIAGAQPAPTAAPAAPPATAAPADAPAPVATAASEEKAPTPQTKEEARTHFEKGLALVQEQAWAAALAEFLVSIELFPTRNALFNASLCYHKLQRFDEALDSYEKLLRDYPNLPADDKVTAQKAVTEMRSRVGTVDVIDAEPGASIVISGQDRGEFPPVAPLRVGAGSHVVRVFKEGYEPYETRVEVAGGQIARVTAKLKKLTDSGRLKITERGGLTLEVLVDGIVVGTTPWEGLVGVGPHTVALRGKGKLGTQPASAVVKSQQLTTLSLTAEDLEASLRVDPTPVSATVAIDGVTVGNGVWLGRLKTGAHKVEITAEGFLPASRSVNLGKGAREIVKLELERDPNAAFWQKPPKIALEASAGFLIIPSFGGPLADACGSGCSQSTGVGAIGFGHGTYELGSGLGFGVSLGYLFNTQSLNDRSATLNPYSAGGAPPPQSGTATDDLRLSAFLGGAHISYRFGDSLPVLLRLGGGAMVGQLRDERKGRFTDSRGAPVEARSVDDLQQVVSVFINPEVKVGFKPTDNITLSGGVQATMLITVQQPRWTETTEVNAGADGLGRYPSESLMGQFVFGISPVLSFRYDF